MAATYDIISELPVESVQEIFMRITPEGLCNVQKCCKKWRFLVNSEYFWKKKLEVDLGFVDQEYLKTEMYQNYIENFSCNLEGQYMYTSELIDNWRNGIFKRRIVSLPNKVEALIYLDHKILIVVVEHCTILIVDISTGTIEKTIFAENLYHVEKSGDKLYAQCRSLGRNRGERLKVWNLQSFKLICDLQTDIMDRIRNDHTIYKHLLIMCISSKPGVLNIFNIKTGKLDYRKVGITRVHCSNDNIAQVTSRGTIEIMDLNYNQLMTFNCYKGCEVIKIKMINDDNLVILFENEEEEYYKICVCNLKTKVKSDTIKKLPIELITFFNGTVLICEVEDTKIFTVFDVLTGKTILEFSTDDRFNFTSNDLFIFTENLETSCIEMWCPRTKSLINCFDLPEQYSVRYGVSNYFEKLYPLASKTTLAFLNKKNNSEVLVMDFAPNISRNSETLRPVPHGCAVKPSRYENGAIFIGAILGDIMKLYAFFRAVVINNK